LGGSARQTSVSTLSSRRRYPVGIHPAVNRVAPKKPLLCLGTTFQQGRDLLSTKTVVCIQFVTFNRGIKLHPDNGG
jgi:hypothetical protein